MNKIFVLLICLLLPACATNTGDILDKLEFKPGQEGCVRASGQIQTGSNPIVSTTLNVNIVKKQGENPPDC